MLFLGRDETASVEQKLRRYLRGKDNPKVTMYHTSGMVSQAVPASAIVDAIAGYSEATLIFKFAVAGDGYGPSEVNVGPWRSYRNWRQSTGEMRRLYDAPGHVFAGDDAAALSFVVHLALEIGWDMWFFAKPGRHAAFFSHDERIEIYSGFEARVLAKRLSKIKGWREAT